MAAGGGAQAARTFHSARSAIWALLSASVSLKWLWNAAWTALNFWRVFILRNRGIARSRQRSGSWTFRSGSCLTMPPLT